MSRKLAFRNDLADGGSIVAYAAYGGGAFLTATCPHPGMTGVSLTTAELRQLVAELNQLANAIDNLDATQQQEAPAHA